MILFLKCNKLLSSKGKITTANLYKDGITTALKVPASNLTSWVEKVTEIDSWRVSHVKKIVNQAKIHASFQKQQDHVTAETNDIGSTKKKENVLHSIGVGFFS